MKRRQTHHQPNSLAAVLAVVISLAASFLAGVGPASATGTETPTASFTAQQVRPIVFPIAPSAIEDVYWSDTWGAPRSGGRSHIGVDILGPKMTPLVAAADGEVTWMRSNGNNMLVITDSQGWQYWYIHLNNDTPGTDDGANNYNEAFAPNIEVGSQVRAGQVIGYMGDSGNAEFSGSQLHFEIEDPEGRNINPALSVDSALAQIGQTDVAAELVAPFESFDAFATSVYGTLVGHPATAAERETLAQAVLQDGMVSALAGFVDADTKAAAIDRLYFAVFNRIPDLEGYKFWIQGEGHNKSLAEISEFFATSDEFKTRFGSDNYNDLLNQIYEEMFSRVPDEEGKAYWLQRLEDPDDPVTPGTLVSYFSEGTEARGIAGARSELVAMSLLLEGRMPTVSELAAWELGRGTQSFAEVATTFFAR